MQETPAVTVGAAVGPGAAVGTTQDAPVVGPPIPPAGFAETDVESLLPPPRRGEPPARRERMMARLAAELAEDRVRAQAAIDGFVVERRARSAELAALKPEVGAALSGAERTAVARIDAAATAQLSAVRAGVRSTRAQLQAQARQVRGQVEAGHASAVAAIRAATQASRVAMQGASTAASGQAGALETAQLGRLGGLYTQAGDQFRGAAQAAGSLAVSDATASARQYRSHKINEEDSFLDGHLTDNRCDAEAEAAEKVGAAYRDDLVKEGDKQVAALNGRRPTDDASVRQVTGEVRSSLATVLQQQALPGLEATEAQSLRNAQAAKAAVLTTVTETLRTAEESLTRHETAQVARIQQEATQRRQAVQQAAGQAVAALNQAADKATTDVDNGLAMLVQTLSAGDVPDPTSLDQTLLDSGAQLDTQLGQLQEGLRTQAAQAGQAVAGSAEQAAAGINEAGAAAVQAAKETGQGAGAALTTAGREAAQGLQQLTQGHQQTARGSETSHATAVRSLLDGLTGSFDRLSTNFTAGAAQQIAAVRQGLTNAVRQDMPGIISAEADKARDQVQPRWKSVLKWVIIIAIVLVVAIVLGPLVIGAVTGAAAALGASAGAAGLIGMVVGGALVGAATSAATTVVDNAFAGRDLTTGLGMAIALGALSGGLGGAAAGFLAGPLQGLTALSRYGVQTAADMLLDTVINAATGNFSWENLATGLLMSALVTGVTAHPRIQAVQHGMSSRGYGFGFDKGAIAHSAITGRGGPGSAGPVTIDAGHVNLGDTAGPDSPYRGTWDMKGGGHNPNEIRPRAAAEGISNTPVAKDPITGVAIDRFGRIALDSSGNPIPDSTGPGGVKVKSEPKSMFPDSMGRPQIEAAGQSALERAIAGSPHTTHTPPGVHPNGKPKNGEFSAIVVTPDGHPIMVKGNYAPAPGGGWEIRTIYPATNLPAGTVPPVPGSQVSVPGGVVTPPDYDYGDG